MSIIHASNPANKKSISSFWQKYLPGGGINAVNNSGPNGILLVNKPIGISSASVDNKIKHHLAQLLGTTVRKAPKVGHAGTLDPFASGLLIVGVGRSTKTLHMLENASKSYDATISLGVQTDTDDLTGEVIKFAPPENLDSINNHNIINAVENMVGVSKQIPCSYSAKRINGERAYNLQRSGKIVELQPNDIEIFSAKCEEIRRGDSDNTPNATQIKSKTEQKQQTIEVDSSWKVSKGTFIRAIARDIGNVLGVGGHLSTLKRTAIGDEYKLDNALELEQILKTANIIEFEQLLNEYPNGSYITVGRFDGVHIGHQKLLKNMVSSAKLDNAHSVAIIINGQNEWAGGENANLTDLKNRINYIFNTGVDEVIVLEFEQVQNIGYQTFIAELYRLLNVRQIFITNDTAFGSNREGNAENITKYANSLGIKVEIVEHKNQNSTRISSTLIRDKLLTGDVATASTMLGKHYKLSGVVTSGHQRGRQIGFPTANLCEMQTIIPANGVYYGSVTFNKQRHPAMISIGNNPTFGNTERSVEVHIPTINSKLNNEIATWFDLYDQKITVSFEGKIREMINFNSVDELRNRLEYDAMLTRTAWEIAGGKVVVIPTDTVLGICCKYDNLGAKGIASSIYALKNRPTDKPLQVLVGDINEAYSLGTFNEMAKEFANDYWPGALTLVVPKRDSNASSNMPSEYSNNEHKVDDEFIGLRVPYFSPIHDLLQLISPLYATSANISGESEFDNIRDAATTFNETIADINIETPWFFDCDYNKNTLTERKSGNKASKVVKIVDNSIEEIRK